MIDITTLSKDDLYECIQLIKHIPSIGIDGTRLFFYLKKSQNKKHIAYDIQRIQKILDIPQHLKISTIIFNWLLNDIILKYDTHNWKPYLRLYTDRGSMFCYHNLIYKTNNYNNISNLNDYNDYILNHINHSSHYDGYCICYPERDNGRTFNLIEGLVSDTRQIMVEEPIEEYLDKIDSNIDDLIRWEIPFRDGIQYTHYPISWLLDNLETVFRGNVNNIKLDSIIKKVKYEIERCKQIQI